MCDLSISNFIRLLSKLMDVITDTLDGAVGDLKEHCIFSIKSTVNTTSDDPRHQPDFVDALVREVENISCPGEPIVCSEHGTCNQGLCTCDTGSLYTVSQKSSHL